MENFVFNMPTNLFFGKDMLGSLPESIKKYTDGRILLTYGGGSIKKNGLYDEVVSLLNSNQIDFIELSGIKPNPEVDTARKGINLIKENKIDFILAVGGGSVLDNSKHMAIGSATSSDIWDVVTEQKDVVIESSKVPKIGTIITLAATGSEMNSGGVISNPEFDMKVPYLNPLMTPVFTYEDPTQLKTLPDYQKRAGLCDIFSHLLEQYFSSHKDDMVDDRLIEALLKNAINSSFDYLETNDYDTLANIFWTSTLALNGLTSMSRGGADWMSHNIEHEISGVTDLTHGIGLAIVQPKVIRYYYEKDIKEGNSLIKYENLATGVFEIPRTDENLALKAVEGLEELFKRISGVTYLEDVDITKLDNDLLAKRVFEGNGSTYCKLSLEEMKELVANFYENAK